MVPFQERFYHPGTLCEITTTVVLPTQAFLPHRPIKALNICLLIFPIWSGNPMTITKQAHVHEEVCLELRPSIC